MRADFQIIHSFKPRNLKKKLLFLLKETIDEFTTIQIEVEEKPKDIEKWSIFDYIEIKYNYPSNNKYIAGFSLDFGEINNDFINEFGRTLEDDTAIDLVIKYDDEVMEAEHQKYTREIFKLEMELREVISFIFLDTYKEDYYNLLRDVNVTVQPLNKKNKPDERHFKAYFENEFFFLLFSDYIRINQLKKLEQLDLINLISDSNNYQNLKEQLHGRGIYKEEYQDFLAGIKQNLDPIENMRNCIAHNRSIPKSDNYKAIVDYETAQEKLGTLIENFWKSIKDDNY